jgi:hypothetical protein
MPEAKADDAKYAVVRKHLRKPYKDNLGIPVTIMQFGKLHRHDITIHGIDISEGGLGIIADVPIAAGFIWFWRNIGRYKGGMIMWSREINGKNRAGIQFLQIPQGIDE